MASRRSHAATNDQQIEFELRVPRSGSYIMKTHCKLRSSAAVGTCDISTKLVPRRGTDASPMMLRMIVGSAMSGCVATARRHSLLCLPLQL